MSLDKDTYGQQLCFTCGAIWVLGIEIHHGIYSPESGYGAVAITSKWNLVESLEEKLQHFKRSFGAWWHE